MVKLILDIDLLSPWEQTLTEYCCKAFTQYLSVIKGAENRKRAKK